ncbi:hypothetical protein J2853_002317 [Streptosporangium lutulentum]|uniref:Uncharacterized protein n=1 Tax=Streptosporangium lutulentum TaxID=1461250 RepID=A0ABT9Q8Q5_9ACTN|nr:hypothetical protein [Streptosporangium lutulentum]
MLIRTVAGSLNPVDGKTRAWEVGPEPPSLRWTAAASTAQAQTRHPLESLI